MKMLLWVAAAVLVLVGGFYWLNSYIYQEKQGTSMENTSTLPEVVPISHATFLLKWDGVVIYNDPIGGASVFEGQPAADIVLVTDIHGDHFDVPTLSAVMGPQTTLVVSGAVKNLLPEDLAARAMVLNNGENFSDHNFNISAVPAYNLPDAENADKHPVGRGNGYVIEKNDTRVYIAGDTAGTPEMRALTGIDIAFVPMNLPYTMSVDEAADAVLAFKPGIVYPYHYRSPDGLADVDKFKSLVNAGDPNIQVVLGKWY